MNNISFFKKLKLFFFYFKSIKGEREKLYNDFFLRIDKVGRMYTVLNIPPEVFDEPYNIRKSDIDLIATNYINKYVSDLTDFLNTKGLVELYRVYDVKKVDKYGYLIILGFSLFQSDVLAKNIMFKLTPTLLVLLSLIFLYFKLF